MNEFITVYSAEMMRRLRSRPFILGLVLGAIGIVAIMRLPSYMEGFARASDRIALAGDPALIAAARPLLKKDYAIVTTLPNVTRVRSGDLQGSGKIASAVVLHQQPHSIAVTVYASDPGSVSLPTLRRDLLPLSIAAATGLPRKRINAAIRVPVNVIALNSRFGTAAQSNDARIVAYLLLFILYLLIMINSQLIMSSVAEEKTSRIAELLVASVNPGTLLGGKIAASATLAIVQMLVWVLVAFFFGAHAGVPANVTENTPRMSSFSFSVTSLSVTDLIGFAIFFILGYLQMSTLFAGVGSLVNRTEDLGALAGPLVIPVVAAFVIAIAALEAPDARVVVVTSFIPIIAPFVMFARLGVSNVPLWQLGLSLAINVAATWAIAILAGKIYRVGMLLYGRTPKFTQILSVLRS